MQIASLIRTIDQLNVEERFGKISSVLGLTLEAVGLEKLTTIGTQCKIKTRTGESIWADLQAKLKISQKRLKNFMWSLKKKNPFYKICFPMKKELKI